jgi:PAS domain-containing protein
MTVARAQDCMADLTAIENPSVGLFEAARDLLQLEGTEGGFVKSNESLKQLLGYSETELRRTAVFDLVSPDDLAAVSGALETLKEGARPSTSSVSMDSMFAGGTGHGSEMCKFRVQEAVPLFPRRTNL